MGGDLALWHAAKRGNAKKLRRAFHKRRGAQELLDQVHPTKGTTPLMVAARHKSGLEVTQALLELGAQPDVVDAGKRGNTALHYAAYHNHVPQLEALLDAQANVFALNRRGHTPLDVARIRGRKEVCAVLTARLQVHSDWLQLRSTSLLDVWKRRWCVLLACNAERSATELCVFRDPANAHPDAVIWVEAPVHARSLPGSSNGRCNGFELDRPVLYQRLRFHRYARDQRTGRTYSQAGTLRPQSYRFAGDTEADRDAWVRVLDKPWRERSARSLATPVVVPAPVAPVAAPAPPTVSVTLGESGRLRAATNMSIPPLAPQIPLVEVRRQSTSASAPTGKLAALLADQNTPNTLEACPSASAPTLSEEDLELWAGLPSPNAPSAESDDSEELFPLADTVSSEPMELVTPQVQDRECIVCMDQPRDAVCVPCGHLAGCYDCLRAVTHEEATCPICRAHVEAVMKVYHC